MADNGQKPKLDSTRYSVDTGKDRRTVDPKSVRVETKAERAKREARERAEQGRGRG